MADVAVPVQRHRLENGLRVVLSPDPSVPVVAVNLWYGVGSRNEREGRTGFAHLFEHMMFQGSAHVGKNGHFEAVERAGGTLNGSTWFDRTNYYETVPSHQLDLALWLESDRMGWLLPAMDQEKLDNQIGVVKNERRWRYDNQPYGDWDERIQRLVWPEEHPYRHTVIGSMEDIGAATLEDVADFFRTFYLPNNAVLTLAGDFDPADALARVERWFGGIPAGPAIPPLPGRTEVEPLIGGTVRETVESDVPLPRVYVAARIPTFLDPSFPVADLAGDVLGAGRASRLYRTLVRERRLAREAGAYVFPLTTGASLMMVWATGLDGVDPGALEAGIVECMEGLATVQPEEVARALALGETRFLAHLEQAGDRADLLSMFELVTGDAGNLNRELDRLRAVTPEGIRRFAEEYLGPDNRAVLTYVPRPAKAGVAGTAAAAEGSPA